MRKAVVVVELTRRQTAVQLVLRDAAEADRISEIRIGGVRVLEARVQVVEAKTDFVGERRSKDVGLRPHVVGAIVLLLSVVAETAAVKVLPSGGALCPTSFQ